MPDNIRKMPEGKRTYKTNNGSTGETVFSRVRKNFFHKKGSVDAAFVCLVMILFAIGVTMLYSASYAYSSQNNGDPAFYFKKQLAFGAVGFVLMFLISKINYKVLNGILTPLIYLFTMLLLAYTLFVNRDSYYKRWIYIGFEFQPSEIAKFTLVLTLAYMICILYHPLIAGRGGKRTLPNMRGLTVYEKSFVNFFDSPFKCAFILAFVIMTFVAMIYLEKHLSCTILMFLLGVSMMWVGGVKKKYFAVLLGVVTVAVIVLMIKPDWLQKISENGYDRVTVWRNKSGTDNADYWQTQQGLWAIASGGPFGVGIGKSVQKYLYIPEPQNDFIFPIVIEELGLVGGAIIILIFAALIFRGFVIATKSKDLFGSLLVTGIMLQLGLQVAINIAVVTDTIPNTGIALPFFSYGGTALIMLLCEMGVVLSVSRNVEINNTEIITQPKKVEGV